RSAPCDPNGLAAMMRFFASRTAAFAGLGAAAILNLRQFVCRKIDDVVLRRRRRHIRPHAGQFCRDNDQKRQEDGFHPPREKDAAHGKKAGFGFAGESNGRAAEGRTDVSSELLPGRRPFDQQLGAFIHAGLVSPGGRVAISSSSPIVVPVARRVSSGSSSTEDAFKRTGAKRQGRSPCSRWTTTLSLEM